MTGQYDQVCLWFFSALEQ